MKKRKQIWIDESLWFLIDNLLKTHPGHHLVNYRSKTDFFEKTIEEKFEDIRNKLVLEKIANAGLDSIVTEVKQNRKMIEGGEAFSSKWNKKWKELKKKKHTRKVHSTKRK